ncbi:unnamed protein product [Arctogadus glacialis]
MEATAGRMNECFLAVEAFHSHKDKEILLKQLVAESAPWLWLKNSKKPQHDERVLAKLKTILDQDSRYAASMGNCILQESAGKSGATQRLLLAVTGKGEWDDSWDEGREVEQLPAGGIIRKWMDQFNRDAFVTRVMVDRVRGMADQIEARLFRDVKREEVERKGESSKVKSELCKNYIMQGQCRYGSKCKFAHGHLELRQNHRVNHKYKTKRCRAYFMEGYCLYGERCNFQHEERRLADWAGLLEGWPSLLPSGLPSRPRSRFTFALI